jgi:RNA polymerase sigma-70 factor (ECF subfamily)
VGPIGGNNAAHPGPDTEAVFIASFAEFYRIHHRKIAGALALNFGNPDLGREAADEAMTRAYDRWGTVSGHDNPAGWVYLVGLNWGRSWFRRASRRLPWIETDASDLPETADPALRAALLDLDHRYRAVVVCRYYLDWSTERTASALDIPTGTVKSRLHQALTQLRDQLEPAVDEPPSPLPEQRRGPRR